MGLPSKCDCLICKAQGAVNTDWPINNYECPRCGLYKTETTVGWLEVKSVAHMVRLSGWVREQNEAGSSPIITPDISQRVAAMRIPGYRERSLRTLKVISRRFANLQSWYDQDTIKSDLELLGRSYSADAGETTVLLKVLIHDNYLESNHGLVHLSVPGLLAVEAISSPNSQSAQGFVAMDFADAMRDAWTNGFDPAIRNAGYRPLRIDSKEFIGGITDEIMSEIRQSRFIVADYTGQKSGVYFEAGFALGLGLNVIPTCRADQIESLHFDIRHLNTLPWTTPADLAANLSSRIRAIVGVGPELLGNE
jgi:hypothetical protein